MSARRRAVETRWSRDAVNDGTADVVAFGAMSIGLVLGTLDKLWPTSIPTVRYEHGIAMSSSIAAHAEEAATAPIDAVQPMSADAAEVGLASSPVHGLDHVSFEPSAPLVDRSQESKAAYESPEQLAPRPLADYTSDAGQQPMSISGSAHHDSHSGDAPDVLSVAPPGIDCKSG